MTSHANFRDDSIMAKADNDITKSTGTTLLQTSSTPYTPYRTCIPMFSSGAAQQPFKIQRHTEREHNC